MRRRPWRNKHIQTEIIGISFWHLVHRCREKKIDCQPRNIWRENENLVIIWLLPSRHKVLEWSRSDPGCFSPSTSSPRLSRQLSEFLLSWMAGHLDPGEQRIWIKMTTQKCRFMEKRTRRPWVCWTDRQLWHCVTEVLFSVFALFEFCFVKILTLPSKSYLPTTFSTLLGAGLMRGVVSR